MQSASPAHATKGVARLVHPLPGPPSQTVVLHQDDTAHGETGTTLWLGAQVLILALHDLYHGKPAGRAIELGAGIGLVSLELMSLGFSVLATDRQRVLDRVTTRTLSENAAAHPEWRGTGSTRALDWTEDVADDVRARAYDLIVAADCVFDLVHIDPLLTTIASLDQTQTAIVLVALERRDPLVIDAFLASASQKGYTPLPAVRTLPKLVRTWYGWPQDEWSGVEIWRLEAGQMPIKA